MSIFHLAWRLVCKILWKLSLDTSCRPSPNKKKWFQISRSLGQLFVKLSFEKLLSKIEFIRWCILTNRFQRLQFLSQSFTPLTNKPHQFSYVFIFCLSWFLRLTEPGKITHHFPRRCHKAIYFCYQSSASPFFQWLPFKLRFLLNRAWKNLLTPALFTTSMKHDCARLRFNQLFSIQSTLEQSQSLVWVLISFSHAQSTSIRIHRSRHHSQPFNFILRLGHDKSTWLIVFPFSNPNCQLSFCF